MSFSEYLVSQELLEAWYQDSVYHWVEKPCLWDEHESEWVRKYFRPTHKIDIVSQKNSILSSDLICLDPSPRIKSGFTPQPKEFNPETRIPLVCCDTEGNWWPFVCPTREWHGASVRVIPTVWVTDTSLIGWVYFIREGKTGPIKIGWSKNPQARLSALQTANSNSLSLIGKIPGPLEEEKRFHLQFRDENIQGEWFHSSGQLMEFLKIKFPMMETIE